MIVPVIKNNETIKNIKRVMNMEKTEIIKKVRQTGMREYGFSNNILVAEKWSSGFANAKAIRKVIGALDNNDADKLLLTILMNNTEAVLQGLAIVAHVTEADCMEILLPNGLEELEEQIKTCSKKLSLDISITTGIVDMRAEKNSIIHHIATLALLPSLILNPEKFKQTLFIFIKKNGQAISEPIEISYGMKINDFLNPELKEDLKAILIGTKLYTADILDMVIDENFPLGNGVITVFDSKCCMTDQATKTALQMVHLSCGKCTFCREGSIQLYTMLKETVSGKGSSDTIPLIKEIGEAMQHSSLCSIGKTASDFALGTVKLFENEIDDHIRRRKCPTQVCSAFMNIYINPQGCVGCGECIDVCPEACIEGKAGYIHMIDEFDCIKCGTCIEACPEDTIRKTSGRLPKLPNKLTKVGRFRRN